MQFVRCEACGAKAIVAASQCPTCGHHLEIRNSWGDLFPMVRCKSCGAHYPRKTGACRWCGPPEPKRPIAPAAWGVGAALLVASVSFGAWQLYRAGGGGSVDRAGVDGNTADPVKTVANVTPQRVTAPTPPAAKDEELVKTAEAATNTPPVSLADTSHATAPVTLALAGADTAPPSEKNARPPGVASTPEGALTPAPRQAPVAPPRVDERPIRETLVSEAVSSGETAEWIDASAITWVNVRADPARESDIVGVISPDTRVKLGELRAGWYRVRAKGISGWVGRRLVEVDSTGR
jgi:Bacterial SH3 domain